MLDDELVIRAPPGAVAWTPRDGYVFDDAEMPQRVERDELVLVVSADGYVRGLTAYDRAPLAALLRIEGDVAELVQRVGEL